MNFINYDFITGMTFGIEFPATQYENDPEDPWPWMVIHLGIIRIFFTKL